MHFSSCVHASVLETGYPAEALAGTARAQDAAIIVAGRRQSRLAKF